MGIDGDIDHNGVCGGVDMGVMRQVIDQSVNVIEAIFPAGSLVLSPTAVNAQNTPQTITERVFSVTMQTQNSDKFRDGSPGLMRYAHALEVSIMCRLKPQNQSDGYGDAIDIEEKIIMAMLRQSNLPRFRVLYDRSQRQITNTGEFVLIRVEFSIEQTAKVP